MATQILLEALDPKSREAVEFALVGKDKNSKFWGVLMPHIMNNIRSFEGISILMRLGLASRRFYAIFWENPRILHVLYRAFRGICIVKGLQCKIPDIFSRSVDDVFPLNWKRLGDMDREQVDMFSESVRKIYFLGHAPWPLPCGYCEKPLGLIGGATLWDQNVRVCYACCREKLFISDRALMDQYDISITAPFFEKALSEQKPTKNKKGGGGGGGVSSSEKKEVFLTYMQQQNIKYLAMECSLENKVLWKLSYNPLDYKQPPPNRSKMETSYVYLFWKPAVMALINEKKALKLKEKKKDNFATLCACLRRSLYRRIAADTFHNNKENGPDAVFVGMKPEHKIYVHDKVMRMYNFIKIVDSTLLNRGGTRFIPDATKFHRKFHKTSVEKAAEFFDWDKHASTPLPKKPRTSSS